jgi:hypothetical protein
MKKYKALDELLTKVLTWLTTTVVDSRKQGDIGGRTWVAQALEVTDTLTLDNTRKITDREDLNKEFSKRFDETDVKKRKGISALKVEIDGLLSFNKCFVERHKSRLEYYRSDMSQRKRAGISVGQALAQQQEFKTALDT